ncbi:7 transmembrane receptor (rhodopsin family) domain-containing protein [Ditylenchus destructor]|nr:7 transmembrane receptor (rhodopsin family) domain-containing protein [Ditylenchus destructor]
MVILYMVITWVCSSIWSSPFAIYFRVEVTASTQIPQCTVSHYDKKFWDVYFALHIVFTYILPLFVCVLFFIASSCLLFLLNRLSRDTARTTNSTSINAGIRALIGIRKQIIKTLAVSILIFILGYTPAAVQLFLQTQRVDVAGWINDGGTLLLILSVSLCPLLFANFSYYYQKRRRELKTTLRTCAAAFVGRIYRCIQSEPPSVDPLSTQSTSPPVPPVQSNDIGIQTEPPQQSDVGPLAQTATMTYVIAHNDIETRGHKSMFWNIKVD